MPCKSFSNKAIDRVIRGESWLTSWRNTSARSNIFASSDFLDAIFATHITVGVLLQNESAWLRFNVGDMPSTWIVGGLLNSDADGVYYTSMIEQ